MAKIGPIEGVVSTAFRQDDTVRHRLVMERINAAVTNSGLY